MNELQGRIWDVLCNLSGEDVARAFTDFYGNQLLTESFAEHLVDDGYATEYELGVNEDGEEDEYDE